MAILSGFKKIEPYLNYAYGKIKLMITSHSIIMDDGKNLEETVNTMNSSISTKAVKTWTLLKNQTSVGNSTITVDITQYSEFMITCGLASSENGNYYRELGSTIVPVQVLTSNSKVDHSSGSHQAYYSSSYNGGISYLGNNQIKIYNNGGITRLYAK